MYNDIRYNDIQFFISGIQKKKNLKSVNEMNNHGQCLCAEFSTEKKQAASSAVGKKNMNNEQTVTQAF